MDMGQYRSIKNKYETKIRKLEDELKAGSPKTADYKQYLDFGFNILQNVVRVYVFRQYASQKSNPVFDVR